MMKNLKMKGEMKLKVRKRLKMLVALVLIFSILCADSNVSLYANDSQETEAMEESFAGQADAETVTKDAVSEETMSEETVSEEVESEEVSAEETATEEADYFEVDLNEAAVADSGGATQRALHPNYQNVCMGGGSDLGGNNGRPNWNNTGMENQDPDSTKKYWNPNATSFNDNNLITEQQLIDLYWPKKGAALKKQRLKDAVIDPTDKCAYGNPINGYGKHVDIGKGALYKKYNEDWTSTVYWSGETPSAIGALNNVQKPSTKYVGNYIYHNGGGWQNPFTIVSRAKIVFESRSRFYVNSPQKKMPIIYDITNGNYTIAEGGHIYVFEAKSDNIGYQNLYPSTMGKYKLTVQTAANVSLFRLPGRATKDVDILPKGYQVTFKKKIDSNVTDLDPNTDWNADSKPTEFDQRVKNTFGIDMYREKQTYTIPVPKYDESKYEFEGWTVEEEYIDDSYNKQTRTFTLNKNGNGTYDYPVSEIGQNAWYLLNSTLTAKLRTRKTFTANVKINLIDGTKEVGDALSITSTSGTTTNNNDNNSASHKYVEGIDDTTQFKTSFNTSYAYEFAGWSNEGSNDYDQYGMDTTFDPEPTNWSNQAKQDETQNYVANYKGKSYRIIFNGNGGVSSGGQTTKTQNAAYYKDVNLESNSFTRNGYTFLGWSTTPNATTREYADGAQVYNLPINRAETADTYPNEVTLYAVWQSPYATTNIEKYKDTLWIEGKTGNAVSNRVYISGSSQDYNVYEIARYYLDIKTATNISQKDLDKKKFYVVWERSTDGGKNFTKIDNNSQNGFFTRAFTDERSKDYSKAVYDQEKNQWFVPLLVQANHQANYNNINGIYRVNVAYDDPNATVKVTSENDFYNNKGSAGWTTSEETEVKVIKTFETVVSIPSTVSLVNKKETNADGSTEEVIKSVHDSNKVTVNPVEHSLTKQADYDWSTPNTAMDGKTTTSNSYNGGQYSEYTKQKPFKVSVEWSGTLKDSTSGYTISNINMYSASTFDSFTKDQQIISGTQASFSYDGSDKKKTLFDFYLKGDKPENLPHGITYEGIIHFKFANIG